MVVLIAPSFAVPGRLAVVLAVAPWYHFVARCAVAYDWGDGA